MSNIFISYSSEDRDSARRLAQALEQVGWSVWWDRKIAVGKSYQRVIETELDAADCVIVIWSENSVASDWVVAEAADGRERNLLVPVSIDNAKPPLIFRQIQTADLSQWDGSPSSPIFRQLVNDIHPLITESKQDEKPALPPLTPAALPPAPTGGKHKKWFASTAAVLIVIALLVAWPYVKTRFISGQQPIPSAQVINFAADPQQIEEGGTTTLSWRTENAQKVTLSSEEDTAEESIEPSGKKIVRPHGTTVFLLKAQGKDVEKKVNVARLTVTVIPAPSKPDPRIAVFEAGRNNLVRGESTALHWETVHASRIELDGAAVNAKGDIEIRPEQTSTFRLTAFNESGKSASGALTIMVEDLSRDEIVEIQELLGRLGYDVGTADGLPGPRTRAAIEAFQNDTGLTVTGLPSRDLAEKLRDAHGSVSTIESLTVDRPRIGPNEKAAIHWRTSGAERVELIPFGEVDPSGSKTVSPDKTTRFELVATSSAGKKISRSVTIEVGCNPNIDKFWADNYRINQGETTYLHWSTSCVELVEITSLGKMKPDGNLRISPDETTTYILTAWGSEKQATHQKVTITVEAPVASVRTVILAGGGRYLDDKRVIYAILYGVPLDGIAAKLFGKVQTIFEFPLGKNKINAAKYNYDVKRSQKLMAEAGLIKGMAAIMVYTEDLADMAHVVENYLNRFGIQVKSKAANAAAARQTAESFVKSGRSIFLLESLK